MEIVEEFIKKANELAEIIYPHGFKFTYHHHNDEFTRLANGKTALEMLAEGLDPEKTDTVTDIDTKETVEIRGSVLVTEGLTVTIPNRYESKILVYNVKK